MFMDRSMRNANVGGNGEETFVYANDVAVVVQNTVSIWDIVNIWNGVMRQNGMKINTAWGKTEFMHLSRIPEQFNFNLREQQINQVDAYIYLGVNINMRNS